MAGIGAATPPRSIVMQPDEPSITAVSTAASAATFSIFLVLFVLIGHTFLLVDAPRRRCTVGSLMLSASFCMCAILRKPPER